MIALDDQTITWTTDDMRSWQKCMPDGKMVVGMPTIELPRLMDLQEMALRVVGGALSIERFEVEEGDRWGAARDLWRDLEKFNPRQLEVTGKIDHMGTGRLTYWITARELGDPDSYYYSGSYMAPDFALARYIASSWEHHKEWMSERVEVTGGLA